jgi:hypothetical protein
LLDFFSSRWRRPARWQRSLPLPVTRILLEVPLCVFILGIRLLSFMVQHTGIRCAANCVGRWSGQDSTGSLAAFCFALAFLCGASTMIMLRPSCLGSDST